LFWESKTIQPRNDVAGQTTGDFIENVEFHLAMAGTTLTSANQ
jgi:hypothetical protein